MFYIYFYRYGNNQEGLGVLFDFFLQEWNMHINHANDLFIERTFKLGSNTLIINIFEKFECLDVTMNFGVFCDHHRKSSESYWNIEVFKIHTAYVQ